MLIYNRVLNKLQTYIKEQDEIRKLKEIDKEFILSFLEYFEEGSKSGKFSSKTNNHGVKNM